MGRLIMMLCAGLVAMVLAMLALPGRGGGAESESPTGADASGTPRGAELVSATARERGVAGESVATSGSSGTTEAAGTDANPLDPALALTERTELLLRVLDEHGGPVADARVEVEGFRKAGQEALFQGRQDLAAPVITDHEGRARLTPLVRAGLDQPIDALDVAVRHPEFAPWRDRSFPLAPGEHEIELPFGANVTVVGWIGRPSAKVTDLEIRVEAAADVAPEDWTPDRQGRLACNWLAPGPHCLVASHMDAKGRRWTSEGHRFDVLPNGHHVLELELFAPERLVGVLSEDVPRPVRGGHAQLIVSAAEVEAGKPTLVTNLEAPVAEDGTFTVEGLPRGHATLYVLADGWASVPASHDRWPVGAGLRIPQESDPHVVAMEPAGALTVTLVDPFGVVLPDTEVVLSPGFLNEGAGGTRLGGRGWSVVTDAEGRAHFPTVPATNALPIAVLHPSYELVPEGRSGVTATHLRAGQRRAVRLELVTKGR